MKVWLAAALLGVLCLSGCVKPPRTEVGGDVPCQYNATQSFRYRLRDWESDARSFQRLQPITSDLGPLPDGISIRAYPDETVTLAGGCPGMKLRVINNTSDPQAIASIDWVLYIRQEALAPDGQWHPIEFPVSGSCNFSFFPVLLEAESYWDLEAPRYQGSFKTRLRFYLIVEQGKYTYSEEFEGSVNPEQLTMPPFDPSRVAVFVGGAPLRTFAKEFGSPASMAPAR